MIVVAVVLLMVVRRARGATGNTRSGSTGIALTMMIVLTAATTGGLWLSGASSAQAATTDSCPTADATPATDTETEGTHIDDGLGEAIEVAIPSVDSPIDEVVTDSPIDDVIIEPEETAPGVEQPASILAVSFPEQTFSTPGDPVSSESYTLVLSRVSGTDDSSPVDLVVPDSASGYWTASSLAEADGSPAADVTVSYESGQTRFTIATQPADSRTFQLVLSYDSSTWDTWATSTGVITRPASTLVVALADHADPTNASATLQIPESGYLAAGGPPGGED